MSFPRYPSYKSSGVEWLGDVPSHWEISRLKRACDAFPSNVDKKSVAGETEVRLCNYTDVYYNDRLVAGMDFMAATATDEQIKRFALRAGDTVITKDSETADDIAVGAFVPHDLPGVVCGYHLSIVRPRTGTHGAFIKWFFDSAYARAAFEVRANGLTRVGLGQYELDNVDLALPPHDEQVAIAAFLDRETTKIDALVAEQERLIELLKEKRQAVISHAVTKGLNPDAPMKPSGIEWLGDVPAHWPVVRLKHVVSSFEQGWSPQCESFPVASDLEWGVLKVGCVNAGTFDPSENKALPPGLEPVPSLSIKAGDLLISRANTRELVGRAAVAERPYSRLLLCDKLYRARFDVDQVNAAYVANYLASDAARGQIEHAATGASASMVNISQSAVLELPVPLPSVAEQLAIGEYLQFAGQHTSTLRADAERAITLLSERRAALISAAVSGQIDIRGGASTAA